MPKISELSAATTVADADLVAIVQDGETKKATRVDLLAAYGFHVDSPFTTASNSFVTVTGLSVPLKASRTYEFEAVIFGGNDGTGGMDLTLASDGTLSATAIIMSGFRVDETVDGSTKNMDRVTALGSAMLIEGGSYQQWTARISGTITVNVAGTANLQVRRDTANGTITVARGSRLTVRDIT